MAQKVQKKRRTFQSVDELFRAYIRDYDRDTVDFSRKDPAAVGAQLAKRLMDKFERQIGKQ